MASAIVEAPTDAVIVPGAVAREWIGADEGFRAFAFETMAARLVKVVTLAVEVTASRMDGRLAALLLLSLAGQRPSGRTIDATHDRLATELGTAREVVSRLLKDFERAGALRLGRGHIVVLDRSILREISAPARV